MEETAKVGKEASATKFKGNRKQFELNSLLNSILTRIEGSVENPSKVLKFVAEGEQVIKERQKLIKVADKNREGCLVVQEYESDDLASDSQDEKKLRKAKSAVGRKRKEIKSISGNALKKFKSGSDSQLFVVRSLTVLL